jgi:hypothetical protein
VFYNAFATAAQYWKGRSSFSNATPSTTTLKLSDYALEVNRFIECHWCSLFNTSQFFQMHRTELAFYFQLCKGNPPEPYGVAHFTSTRSGHYLSPCRGTFGGFEFKSTPTIQAVEAFVAGVLDFLAENGARIIELRSSPSIYYSATAALLHNVLLRNRFRVQVVDLDYVLTVDETPLIEKVSASRRQRIVKCRREGFEARRLDPSMARSVYATIAENRHARSYPLTMTYDAVIQMMQIFPDHLILFGVFLKDELIAASICVKVNAAVLYVFYWGDLPGYEPFSPIALLAETIYDYAHATGFQLLDLGTATDSGTPNYGLIDFKHSLGCVESQKLSFIRPDQRE